MAVLEVLQNSVWGYKRTIVVDNLQSTLGESHPRVIFV